MPAKTRGTTNGNARGNAKDRRARKLWLLKMFESDLGPGTCRCFRCGTVLVAATVTIDRILPGVLGGKYVRENIRPACAWCNSTTGGGLHAR